MLERLVAAPLTANTAPFERRFEALIEGQRGKWLDLKNDRSLAPGVIAQCGLVDAMMGAWRIHTSAAAHVHQRNSAIVELRLDERVTVSWCAFTIEEDPGVLADVLAMHALVVASSNRSVGGKIELCAKDSFGRKHVLGSTPLRLGPAPSPCYLAVDDIAAAIPSGAVKLRFNIIVHPTQAILLRIFDLRFCQF